MPATFWHLATIPVTSVPGWFHRHSLLSRPSPSPTCAQKRNNQVNTHLSESDKAYLQSGRFHLALLSLPIPHLCAKVQLSVEYLSHRDKAYLSPNWLHLALTPLPIPQVCPKEQSSIACTPVWKWQSLPPHLADSTKLLLPSPSLTCVQNSNYQVKIHLSDSDFFASSSSPLHPSNNTGVHCIVETFASVTIQPQYRHTHSDFGCGTCWEYFCNWHSHV